MPDAKRSMAPPQEGLAARSFRCLKANDWTLICSKANRRVFTLGQQIIREGAPGETIYIIRRGTASVEMLSSASRTPVAWLKEGDICGDMAFIERGNATASVIAKEEEVEADEIRVDDLRRLFDTFPGLASRFYESMALILVRRLRHTSRELVQARNAAEFRS